MLGGDRLAASGDLKGARKAGSKQGRSFWKIVETFGCCIRKGIGMVARRISHIKGDACLSSLVTDHVRPRANADFRSFSPSGPHSSWAQSCVSCF